MQPTAPSHRPPLPPPWSRSLRTSAAPSCDLPLLTVPSPCGPTPLGGACFPTAAALWPQPPSPGGAPSRGASPSRWRRPPSWGSRFALAGPPTIAPFRSAVLSLTGQLLLRLRPPLLAAAELPWWHPSLRRPRLVAAAASPSSSVRFCGTPPPGINRPNLAAPGPPALPLWRPAIPPDGHPLLRNSPTCRRPLHAGGAAPCNDLFLLGPGHQRGGGERQNCSHEVERAREGAGQVDRVRGEGRRAASLRRKRAGWRREGAHTFMTTESSVPLAKPSRYPSTPSSVHPPLFHSSSLSLPPRARRRRVVAAPLK